MFRGSHRQQLVVALAALVALCAFAAAVEAAGVKGRGGPPTTMSPKYKLFRPKSGKRNQVFTCDDPKDHNDPCTEACPARCPNECFVYCELCITFCSKHTYP